MPHLFSTLALAIAIQSIAATEQLRGSQNAQEERKLQDPVFPNVCGKVPLNGALHSAMGQQFGLEYCESDITAPGGDPMTSSIQGCLIGFEGSGFKVEDVANYRNWYTEDSYVEIAETGVYKGVEAIKEYLGFGAVTGQYMNVGFEKFADGVTPKRIPVALQADGSIAGGGGNCEIALISIFELDLDNPDQEYLHGTDIITKGGKMTTTVIGTYKYRYFMPGVGGAPFGIEIESLRAAYQPGWWEAYAYKFQTSAFENYLCNTMKTECPSTWAANGFENQGVRECKDAVAGLPRVDSEGGWNGASLGCRLMHLSFVARGNPNHCNHVSFDPIKDNNGKIKCQYVTGRTTSDVMTDTELAISTAVGAGLFGQGPDGFTCTGDCL